MDAQLWKSEHIGFVEFLSYDGRHVGTRTFLKDGRAITNILYPDIQHRVMTAPGFQKWIESIRLPYCKRELSQAEYAQIQASDVSIWEHDREKY